MNFENLVETGIMGILFFFIAYFFSLFLFAILDAEDSLITGGEFPIYRASFLSVIISLIAMLLLTIMTSFGM